MISMTLVWTRPFFGTAKRVFPSGIIEPKTPKEEEPSLEEERGDDGMDIPVVNAVDAVK